MLAIRLQRTGRSGHAQYRMVVQDSRRTPTSGKYVALLGSYDPHAKSLVIDKEKAQTFLNNGAQPSSRVAVLLSAEGIKMPTWVKMASQKSRSIRNADKLRRNRPAEEPAPEEPAAETAPSEEAPAEEAVVEAPAE